MEDERETFGLAPFLAPFDINLMFSRSLNEMSEISFFIIVIDNAKIKSSHELTTISY